MNDLVSEAARAAAARLAAEHGPDLAIEVEVALHERDGRQPPERYVVDPVSVGSLIVAIATLAWTVYRDLRKKKPSPPPDVVARTVRVEVWQQSGTPPPGQDKILHVVVEEVIKSAADQE